MMTKVAQAGISYGTHPIGRIIPARGMHCFECGFCGTITQHVELAAGRRAFTNHVYAQHAQRLKKIEGSIPALFWTTGRQLWEWAA